MTSPATIIADMMHEVTTLRNQRDELRATETNLRQQIAHLTDQLAGEKSNVEFVTRQRDELLKSMEWIASSLPQIGVERTWMLDCANKSIASVKGGK